jgi:hypothetical protein
MAPKQKHVYKFHKNAIEKMFANFSWIISYDLYENKKLPFNFSVFFVFYVTRTPLKRLPIFGEFFFIICVF